MAHVDHREFIEGCFQCKLASVSFAPSARGSEQAQSVNAKDRNWSKDHDAYRRLRKGGLQPGQIDGAAQLESRASTQREIEHGYLYKSDQERKQVEAAFDTARDL